MSAATCPTVPTPVPGTAGQSPNEWTTRGTACGTIDLKALAAKVLSRKTVGQTVGQGLGQAKNEWDKPGTSLSHDDAHYAFERLQWCLDAYRAEGLRLHFYTVSPKPEFTMIYPKAFTPSERIMAQDYFLGAVDLIAEHAQELGGHTVDTLQNWRRAA